MRRNRASIAVLLVARGAPFAACAAPTDPYWTDAGIHVVDGYWVPAEQPCDLASTHDCVIAVRAVEASLDIDPRAVVAGAIAGLPTRWVRSDGQDVIVIPSYSGAAPEFVILDLLDGSHRASGYGCWGVPNEDGSMNCGVVPLDRYRVGTTPFD